MGLETGTYISDLVITNPTGDDPKSQGDDHLRLLKSTIKATLPNVAGAVTPTHLELNYVAGVTSAIQPQIALLAPIANPALTGIPTAPTAAPGTSTPQLATTGFAAAGFALLAPLANPALTGTPTAPTAMLGTNNTQLATTGFVAAQVFSTSLPGQAGNAGKVLGTNGTTASWVPGGVLLRDPRTSNAALSLADLGKWIDCSGNYTQTFAASAALTTAWWAWISNTGTGTVTLTPNGAELIDGLASRVIYPNERRLIQCDGSTLRTVAATSNVVRRPIFSPESATMNAGSSGELLENLYVTTNVAYSNSLATNGTNIVSSGTSGTLASSPDGRTWTNRSAAGTGAVASDGAGFLSINPAGTTATYSPNGITWTSVTAIPATVAGGQGTLAAIPGRYLTPVGSSNGGYVTTNNGSSWTAVTLPLSGGFVFSSAGLFICYAGYANNTYYTSATGATGSWTIRSLPGAAANMRMDVDGSLISWNSSSVGSMYRSTDAINWTQLSLTLPTPSAVVFSIKGVVFNGSQTFHQGKWPQRAWTAIPNLPLIFTTAQLGNICLFPVSNSVGKVVLIDYTAADAATGLFD